MDASTNLIAILQFQHHLLFDLGAKDLQVELFDPINEPPFGRICAAVPIVGAGRAGNGANEAIRNSSLLLKTVTVHEIDDDHHLIEFEFIF